MIRNLVCILIIGLVGISCAKFVELDLSKDPHLKIASALDRAGDLHHALQELEIALQKGENKAEIEQYKANILQRRQNAQATLNDLQIGLKNQVQQHRYNRYYYQAGICYELLDQDDQAMTSYTRSIALKPQAMVYVQRALLLARLGQNQAAQADFEKALQLDANQPRALFHLAMFHYRLAQWDRANAMINQLEESRKFYADILKYYLKQSGQLKETHTVGGEQDPK